MSTVSAFWAAACAGRALQADGCRSHKTVVYTAERRCALFVPYAKAFLSRAHHAAQLCYIYIYIYIYIHIYIYVYIYIYIYIYSIIGQRGVRVTGKLWHTGRTTRTGAQPCRRRFCVIDSRLPARPGLRTRRPRRQTRLTCLVENRMQY